MANDFFVTPDTTFGTSILRSNEGNQKEVQSGPSYAQGQGMDQGDIQHNKEGRSMELDDEALAPAFKAPQAP